MSTLKRRRIESGTKEKVFEKTGGKCFYCGVELEDEYIFDERGNPVIKISRWHVDHMIPLSKGGTYKLDNLVPACIFCNESKGAMTAEEFIAKRAK